MAGNEKRIEGDEEMKTHKPKYYLFNLLFQPHSGTAIYPNHSVIFAFAKNQSPKECFSWVEKKLNTDPDTCGIYTITNMKRIK